MRGHDDGGGGIYKVGTEFYRKKQQDKKANLPKITVNGVRIVNEEEIKQILQQLGIENK